MNERDTENMTYEEMSGPLQVPSVRRIGVINPVHRCLFYSVVIMICFNTCVLLGLLIMVAPETGELKEIVNDSGILLKDLKIIIPEIKDSLEILKDFCTMEEFHKYCYPNLY